MQDVRYSDKGVVPSGTVAVTLGIDTQNDGFYWLLACWQRRMELWLPLTDRIVGDMREEAVWESLAEILSTTWLDRDGNGYRAVASGLDIQGNFYPECLEFVRAWGTNCRLRALRGYAPGKGHGVGRSFGILRNAYRDKTTGVLVQNVDVDHAKTQLSDMLARREPGPGYVHLPCGLNGEDVGGWDLDVTEELNAEYRRKTNVRGYEVERWYKHSGRANHRLDCLCYALAALSVSRLKIDHCELQRVEARNLGRPMMNQPRPVPRYGARPISSLSNVSESWFSERESLHRGYGAGGRSF